MVRPTHLQPPAQVTAARQAVTRRAADLCRADPARFALVVRLADQLRAGGAQDLDGALRQALDAHGA